MVLSPILLKPSTQNSPHRDRLKSIARPPNPPTSIYYFLVVPQFDWIAVQGVSLWAMK